MHYDKSPITEALIDIKTEVSDLKFEELNALTENLGREYPRTETRTLTTSQISFGAEPTASAEQKPFSLMFYSADSKQIFQARTDGITFSRLAPYQMWGKIRDETQRLWNIYRQLARPTKVTRLAVRYINQFDFPGKRVEPEDYLKTFPELSRELPSALRDIGPFVMRLPIPQPDLGGVLVLTEALAPLQKPETVSFIFDIDLFVENLEITDESGLWDKLEQLSERKNLFFEACITDKTRELIK